MKSYYIFGITDRGNYRETNEDSILIDHEVHREGSCSQVAYEPLITAVCDGVGGENAGEIASDQCLRELSLISYSSQTDIDKTIGIIHNRIKQRGVRLENAINMQTTLCGLFIDENSNALCVNIGDSRMYRYTDGDIRQISTDQSLAQFLYDDGAINEFDELAPQMRSAIISSLGSINQPPKPQYVPLVTSIGDESSTDIIIICSDGISDFVSIDEMQIILSMDMVFDDKIKMILKMAARNGSTDNMSLIGLITEKQLTEHDKAVAQRREAKDKQKAQATQKKAVINADLEELSQQMIAKLREELSGKE